MASSRLDIRLQIDLYDPFLAFMTMPIYDILSALQLSALTAIFALPFLLLCEGGALSPLVHGICYVVIYFITLTRVLKAYMR